MQLYPCYQQKAPHLGHLPFTILIPENMDYASLLMSEWALQLYSMSYEMPVVRYTVFRE